MQVYGNSRTRDREYLFIDGGCLRSVVRVAGAEVFGDGTGYEPLISALAEGQFDKVFYYDAVPGRDHNEAQAAYEIRVQPDYERFSKIQALDRVHVALGQIVGKDKRQKGVDVRLAVDMMTAAFRGNMTRATLFAGDADFVPLIKALVSEGLHLTLWHPPQANADLRGAADSTRLFRFSTDHRCFTRDGVHSAFSLQSSGSSDPSQYGIKRIMNQGSTRFAGRWSAEILRVWRSDMGDAWSYMDMAAPGASLSQALMAFERISGWENLAVATDWIEP